MPTEYSQYGVAVMPLSDLVSSFCIEQGNDKRTVYLKTLKHAEWAWKELGFSGTLWSLQTVVLEVCKTKHTITLPNNCNRLVNISVVDQHNRLHPLTEDTGINTAETRCPKFKCSCGNCHGENSLCGALDAVTMTTEQVDVKGTSYTLTNWVKMDGEGNIFKSSKVPTWDTATNSVIYTTQQTFLCNVEVNEKGCIKPTQPNIDSLSAYCGWGGDWFYGNIYATFQGLMPAPYNPWGHYNRNAASPNIIHIVHGHHQGPGWPNNGTNPSIPPEHINHWDGIRSVIVTYQTNGETEGSEILVPDYAYDAVLSGIVYRQHWLNPRDGDKDNVFKHQFNSKKMDVMKYLNPIRLENIGKVQVNKRLW